MSDHQHTDDLAIVLQCMLQTYESTARRSGRTQRMIDTLQPGDLVVCATPQTARALDDRIRGAGLKRVRTYVTDPQSAACLHRVADAVTASPPRRLHFDHGWLLGFYTAAITTVAGDLAGFQEQARLRWDGLPYSKTAARSSWPKDWK